MTRFPFEEMALIMEGLANGKAEWLQRHSYGRMRRPDFNVQQIKREWSALKQAQRDYENAAQKVKDAEAMDRGAGQHAERANV